MTPIKKHEGSSLDHIAPVHCSGLWVLCFFHQPHLLCFGLGKCSLWIAGFKTSFVTLPRRSVCSKCATKRLGGWLKSLLSCDAVLSSEFVVCPGFFVRLSGEALTWNHFWLFHPPIDIHQTQKGGPISATPGTKKWKWKGCAAPPARLELTEKWENSQSRWCKPRQNVQKASTDWIGTECQKVKKWQTWTDKVVERLSTWS